MAGEVSESNIAGKIEKSKTYGLKKTGASADDIVHVWNYVSSYINSQMQRGKGVNIIGLGQFTFIHKKIDVGNNKYLLVQRPVFILSEKFAQKHQLSTSKHHLTGQISVSDLNYTAVAFDTPFSRDVIEECMRNVILEFSRALSGGKNIEFSFSAVGRLSIRNGKVKMRFYKEFVGSLEGSEEILNSMKDRPDTADSVMSRASTVRAQSVNTMILPGIGESKASKRPGMAPIDESSETILEPITDITEDPVMTDEIKRLDESGEIYFGDAQGKTDYEMNTGQGYYSTGAQELDSMGLPAMLLEDGPHPATLAAKDMLRSGSRALAPISKAGAFSFDDITPRSGMPTNRTPLPGGTGDITRRSAAGSAPPTGLRRSATLGVDISGRRSQLSPLAQPTEHIDTQANLDSVGAAWPAQPRVITPTESECGHNNAGQELCYLCHQRAARNIPVSFDEEKKRREVEEDRILQEYQILKNNEFILGEQEKNLARRHALQKQAAFNLGVAEAINEKKNARPEPEFPKAYIFNRRPLTPPRYLKQQQLNGFLSNQINHKDAASRKERADKEFLERLEQVQLAEDLAAQRDQYMKERLNEREKYKDALATQLQDRWSESLKNDWWVRNRQTEYILARNNTLKRLLEPISSYLSSDDVDKRPTFDLLLKYKPMQVPDRVPDNEVFGKHDTTFADIIARREHAKKIANEQIGTVADRKRAEILKRLQEQQEEEDVIRKNKAELLEDRANRYQRIVRNRQSLEQDWVKAAEQKKGREIEERLRCLTPGALVHEQCDKYKRCAQCKKKSTNCGETNLWKESYYIPGARIMV